MMYTTFATVPCYYHLDLFSDILTKNWATVNFSISSSIMLSTRNVRWSKIDLIVCHVSYFKFAARAIKPHFHATFVFFFFLVSEYCLRYGKTGNTKLATCFASLLQNRLNSDVARYIYHPHKTCLATDQIRLLTGLNMGMQNKLHVFLLPVFPYL